MHYIKTFLIKHDKKINKAKYLSHQKKESFLFQTLPSFARAYQTYKNQVYTEIQNHWTEKNNVLMHASEDSLTITWLGHASFLIQYNDIAIVTDPVFGSLPLFPRITNHGVSVDSLPHINTVLISHNHPDHMDFPTLTHLAYRYKYLTFAVPDGDKKWLPKRLFSSIYECTWYDELIVESANGTRAHCTFLPSYHWSRRGLFDTNQSLWGSWLIKIGEYSVYFGGDSAYFEHFGEIGNTYTIDIALLPIAPIEPSAAMSQSHMNPNDAGRAFFDLNAKIFIPMHWGTFQFGVDNWADPVRLMLEWKQNNNEKLLSENKKLCIIKIGERFEAPIKI